MKREYEYPKLSIVMFKNVDVIVASQVNEPTSGQNSSVLPSEDNEMEIL